MHNKLITGTLLLFSTQLLCQLTVNLESNSQYYIDDNKIKLSEAEVAQRFRSNNYLNASYKLKDFTFGAQLESYEPEALLNYNPAFKKTNIGTYYINYSNEKSGIDATVGHFYEQFGSGLALRLWEDKQLGIANSLLGGKIKYTDPAQIVTLKALLGKQRTGFGLTEGLIGGLDAEVRLDSLMKSNKLRTSVGFSYVSKNEDNKENDFNPKNVSIYGSRIKMEYSKFAMEFEYLYKTKDNIKQVTTLDPNNIFSGNAYYLNLSYATNNFGIIANFRRLENFNFYSQRNQIGNIYNNAVLNYVPSLTKQFDYSLANIYVYQAQPQLTFLSQKKAGEIGSQFDIFYKIKKGTLLGGKYGTDLSLNISNWYGLKGKYRSYINDDNSYETEFLKLGEKYYSDQSLDIRTRLKENWKIALVFINQYYNTYRTEETTGEVKAQTVVLDNIYRFPKSSIKIELQHQWADGYHGNWAAGLAEYNFKKHWSVFINDLYNYGNSDKEKQMHYYTGGLVFRKNSTRIQASYGRQRGGLLCVGGVCRFVPESAGFTLGISTNY
ncbi:MULTISPECIES: DUF6029 family protein [Chryseobacterium]|uniref:Uncharacterized protein n=1 Tax=Chryseobacterium geocarposphaerae TaxID=1416776 RepID=A0ABU1L8V9_9FLAO|nr:MULTISPECIES: DUF6029 family protein [Chryseobacterium]MDR6403151.1 hypothetical protein [Chryseobacterium geocarposphaerae]MDR6696706.1 hypothetical protein [Chryseobacterium ginsenosidimutans]